MCTLKIKVRYALQQQPAVASCFCKKCCVPRILCFVCIISIRTYTIKDVRSTASLISVLPKLIINTPSNCWSCAKEHINRFSQLLRGTSAFCAQCTTVASQSYVGRQSWVCRWEQKWDCAPSSQQPTQRWASLSVHRLRVDCTIQFKSYIF